MKKIFFLTSLIIFCISFVEAAYLVNVPQTLVQPDGDTLYCFASGDEFHNWLHDANGYTIIKNNETGFYVYADKVGEQIVATNHVAGRVNPASVGLTPGVNISAEEWLSRRQAREAVTPTRHQMRDGNTNHGTMNNIVIFIRFSDDDEFSQDLATVNAMFNANNETTPSLYGYFKSASYNQLEIHSTFYPTQSGTTILSYQDTYPRNFFQPNSNTNPDGYTAYNSTEREQSLLARAVNAVASQIPASLNVDFNNDGSVDNVVFVVKGTPGDWNTILWPHQWDIILPNCQCYINNKRVGTYNLQLCDNPSYFNVSVLCHEMNHTLGAPDLYHYYNGTNLAPVGKWDLMAQNENPPQNMNAYMKYKYGNWIDSIPEITECGLYTLNSLAESDVRNCYRIASPDPDIFYLLEYRNKGNQYDGTIPTSGLLIYRIDTRYEGCADYDGSSHFDEIYVYRRNGTQSNNGNIAQAAFGENLNRTEFHYATNPRPFLTDGSVDSLFYIHQVTEAGGDSISFTFCPQNYLTASPANITLGTFAGSSQSVSISSDMDWTLACDSNWLSFSSISGHGDATISITSTTENECQEDRSCTLTITGASGFHRDITITQRGQTPYFAATIEQPLLDNSLDASSRIFIETNRTWNATSDVAWATISQTSGQYDDTITISINELNSSCLERSGVLSFHYGENGVENLTIRQAGEEPVLEITLPMAAIDNVLDAQYDFHIHANSPWTLTSPVSWLSFTPTSGDGDASVTATVTEINTSGSDRTASVLIETSCELNDTIYIVQSPYLGVQDDIAFPVRVFPNPTHDRVTVDIQQSGNFTYRLYDMQGALIWTGNLPGQQTDINIRQLSAGIYFLQILTDAQQMGTYRIVKD